MAMIPLSPAGAAPAAKPSSDQEVVRVSRELESVFLGMVFEEMAQTVPQGEGLFEKEPGSEMYEQWMRAEVAKSWAQGGGTGLGDQIARSLGAKVVHGAGVAAHPLLLPGAARGLGTLPVDGPLSSGFGPRLHPVTHQHDEHQGIDLAVPEGTPVRAAFSGKVAEVRDDPHGGRMVVLEHAGGYRSVYAHNSRIDVRPGQEIREGEVIAASGQTGRTTGPHLHFGLYQHGRAVDPRRWLKFPVR